jgi:hypothetical protein
VNKQLEQFEGGFEKLQRRYDGAVTVLESGLTITHLSADQYAQNELQGGFIDISMKPQDLDGLIGRVVLSPDRQSNMMKPAVITKKAGVRQLTRLDQPFDPTVGVTDGILFGLGLKNDTAQPTFGAHITAGGFEAGHLAPAFIGVVSPEIKSRLKSHGDEATHQVGAKVGGVAEAMVESGLLTEIKPKTVELPAHSDVPIPLYWHPSLESDEGMQIAQYEGAVKLMFGAATLRLGGAAVDRVGELVDDVIRDASH